MKLGAIFDMDGTLLDTERMYREAWMELAEEFGQTPNPQFPLAVCGSSGENMRNIVRQYYPDVDAQTFIESCIARVAQRVEVEVPKKPGAEEILQYLHDRGVKIAVASSNSHAQIEKNLRLAGIWDYFDAIAGGDEIANSKPAPDIFLLAARRLGLAPEDCYAIEDGANGLHAAAAAGCTTLMVLDLTPPTEELRGLCAGIYENFSALHDALAKGRV